eukprot:g5774.t1
MVVAQVKKGFPGVGTRPRQRPSSATFHSDSALNCERPSSAISNRPQSGGASSKTTTPRRRLKRPSTAGACSSRSSKGGRGGRPPTIQMSSSPQLSVSNFRGGLNSLQRRQYNRPLSALSQTSTASLRSVRSVRSVRAVLTARANAIKPDAKTLSSSSSGMMKKLELQLRDVLEKKKKVCDRLLWRIECKKDKIVQMRLQLKSLMRDGEQMGVHSNKSVNERMVPNETISKRRIYAGHTNLNKLIILTDTESKKLSELRFRMKQYTHIRDRLKRERVLGTARNRELKEALEKMLIKVDAKKRERLAVKKALGESEIALFSTRKQCEIDKNGWRKAVEEQNIWKQKKEQFEKYYEKQMRDQIEGELVASGDLNEEGEQKLKELHAANLVMNKHVKAKHDKAVQKSAKEEENFKEAFHAIGINLDEMSAETIVLKCVQQEDIANALQRRKDAEEKLMEKLQSDLEDVEQNLRGVVYGAGASQSRKIAEYEKTLQEAELQLKQTKENADYLENVLQPAVIGIKEMAGKLLKNINVLLVKNQNEKKMNEEKETNIPGRKRRKRTSKNEKKEIKIVSVNKDTKVSNLKDHEISLSPRKIRLLLRKLFNAIKALQAEAGMHPECGQDSSTTSFLRSEETPENKKLENETSEKRLENEISIYEKKNTFVEDAVLKNIENKNVESGLLRVTEEQTFLMKRIASNRPVQGQGMSLLSDFNVRVHHKNNLDEYYEEEHEIVMNTNSNDNENVDDAFDVIPSKSTKLEVFEPLTRQSIKQQTTEFLLQMERMKNRKKKRRNLQ